jgi:UrcA family protein
MNDNFGSLKIRRPSMWKTILPVGLLATSLDAGAAIGSSVADQARQVTVPIQDLNASRPDDAAKLYQRLRKAAREVCSEHGRRDLSVRRDQIRCETLALEQTVRSLDKPLVTAAHASWRSKRSSRSV